MMRIGALAKRWCFTRQERGPLFALVWTALFAAVQVIGHSDHELWKDELHCWGVGRASTGLWDMLTGERRYDGHPFLWYYLLHLASRLTRSYVMLHVVGVSVATACAYVWLRYMRAPRLLRQSSTSRPTGGHRPMPRASCSPTHSAGTGHRRRLLKRRHPEPSRDGGAHRRSGHDAKA